ncbi:regulatory protein, LuxR [Sphingobium indicum BiD32]|uniref:Regulatory protein, LuxR n=1 Tax=Sphingobium indicum BiD32 TaxID=1301087 RepID=N1MKC3_9SPHN|nr:helix-turn-helix transcriptional regulator [Sphingobium indicum]CCW16087.1 regulatory protein, LuxR [Sphingobium indicum BiD32]
MRLDDGGLLAALHEGMFQQPLWHDFLEKLRLRTGAVYTTLVFRPVDEDAIVELHAGPPPPTHLHTLFVEKYGRDPFPYRHMRDGRVYALAELLEESNPVHRAFHSELLVPQGITDMRSIRVTEPSGVDGWLASAGGRSIGPAVSALLTALAPHLRIALRSFVALEREKLRSTLTSEAFGRLNFGWLTLDARCRIIDMTAHVEQLFQRTSVLRRGRYDRLTPASPLIDRELTALVRHMADDPDSRPRAINLSRDPWMDILVAPIRGRSVSAGSTPVAIAYLSGDRWSQADRCEQLVELFGLLPSEARLAWAIAQGIPISEAATNLGITVETARNYSKKIYAKTGARGQAELVRIVLTSVLAIA